LTYVATYSYKLPLSLIQILGSALQGEKPSLQRQSAKHSCQRSPDVRRRSSECPN
jgi:hypothetical protein